MTAPRRLLLAAAATVAASVLVPPAPDAASPAEARGGEQATAIGTALVLYADPPRPRPRRIPRATRSRVRTAPVLVRSRTDPQTATHQGRGSGWVDQMRLCIRHRESTDNYQAVDPGRTSWGAYQFLDSTWQHVTGMSGHASSYSRAVQDAAFLRLFAGGRGRHQWSTYPACRAIYGGPT